MSKHIKVNRIRKLKWQVVGGVSLLITFVVIYLYFFRDVSISNSLLIWFVANFIVVGCFTFAFSRIEKLNFELDKKIELLEKKAQQNVALALLSRGFSATQDEAQIHIELVERLHAVQGYDYVAVFTVDELTRNRILQTEVVKERLPSIPVLRPGEGLSERAILDGKLHYSPDITKEANHVPGLTQGSEVDVPIEYDSKIMGVVVVESIQKNAFDENDFELLTIVAEQAALALNNARLLSAEKERRHQAEFLYQVSTALTTALELDAVLEVILEQLRHVVAHDSACIFIWQNDTVQAVAAWGLPNQDDVVGNHFPASNELFQLVLQDKRPVILNDIKNDIRFEGWGGTQKIRSWMGLPLITNDKVIGYLTLDSLRANSYSENQTELALIFANQAAIMIENARLYRGVKDSADRQAALYQASQDIIKAGLDTDQIYQAIHIAAAQIMPTDSFVISILDEKNNEIEAAYLFDRGKREEPRRVPFGTGLSGYIIKTGEPLLAYDYERQEELQVSNVVHFGSDDHVRSLLAVPMRLGGKVMGMLSTQTYEAYDYTDQDQQLLDMLAAYAAIAIDNARLFSEVQRLAITDSLTGAYNRRFFFDAAHKELTRSSRYSHPISVMMLDLDYYKEINDTYGHDVGDQALQLITQRCLENIREVDILARYGGDEFIILLPETKVERATEIAERLRKNMENHPIQTEASWVSTSVSIGVAGANNATPELKNLLKSADIALYEAKEAGRNCVRFKHCPNEKTEKRNMGESK